jgi:hypothetical protein
MPNTFFAAEKGNKKIIPANKPLAIVSTNTQEPVQVQDIKIDFKYVASPGQLISFYNPSEYPTLEVIPLASGRKAKFSLLKKVIFEKIEKMEKIFVPESNRNNFEKGVLDSDGYNQVTRKYIQATITTLKGDKIVDIVKTPDHSGMWLKGETDIGDYDLNVYDVKGPIVIEFKQLIK